MYMYAINNETRFLDGIEKNHYNYLYQINYHKGIVATNFTKT